MTGSSKKRILMLGNSHLVIFGFRGELIERLVKEGHEVVVSFPNGPFGNGDVTSKEYGCKFYEIYINRRGKKILEELKLIQAYGKMIKEVKPDIVLAYTVKCDIYGGIICRLLNIPFIPNITGLGKGLAEGGLTKNIIVNLYKVAIRKAECVFFQNVYDKNFFDKNKIKYRCGKIIPGSGVNLEKYCLAKYPKEFPIVFTYIARVMKAKGIEQFLEAADIVKQKYRNVEFHVCGYCEEDYKQRIQQEEERGNIIYHGLVNNIIEYEQSSHCIVLPSFHPEGTSNVLLESAACGRPIITTNRPGCRETVVDGITGFLVKEKNTEDLVEKIEMFLKKSYIEREKMGIEGRKRIAEVFDRRIVVEEYLKVINGL